MSSSFTILVVDDFEPFRQFVRSTLEGRGEFEVIDQASDGLEAVQKAETKQPDLVVLDIGLPKLNGIEVADRLHGLAPRTKILFVSQHSSADFVREAMRSGAMGYVHKSRALTELLPAVEAVLAGRQFVSSGVAEERQGKKLYYSFDFDSTNRILRFHLKGRITDELMRTFYYGMRGPVDRAQPHAGILDTSRIVSFEVSSQLIRELAMASPIMPDPDFPRVVIAPAPDVYGMMRMFAEQGEVTRRNLHVVRAERQAWAVLGVDNPQFKPLDAE
jgi:DNA-binding NarL/FixJ family response regulator